MSLLPSPVSVLLLGSGWTSRFLLPALRDAHVSYAYTKRKPSPDDIDAKSFQYTTEGNGSNVSAFQNLPKARMVVVIFPLTSTEMVDEIVKGYETATDCTPAWVALGSTGAWDKGIIDNSTPISESSTRAVSERHLLTLHNANRPTTVLNLSGLYGGGRNPVNFAKKVGETKEKLEKKSSLHLVHGKDVAQAIIGLWEALKDPNKREKIWGKRWIVTDTHVYDWWHLFTTLQPLQHNESREWIKELCHEHGISSLPRDIVGEEKNQMRNSTPYVLDRALEGTSFWNALGKKPLIGRCDDYTSGGGGKEIQDEERSKEAL